MNHPSESTRFKFGHCEVELESREVRLRGKPRHLAPKVFDLLVFLLERAGRVVSKRELLDNIWPGVVVSEGAVAASIMKARRAIGDTDDASPLIKTVRRVGYLFVAKMEPSARVVAPATPAAAGPGALRLGLLPFENATGDPRNSWVELGLMSLVGQALEADRRISVTSPAVMLGALHDMPPLAHPAERARALQKLFGLQCVLDARVFRDQTGYALEFRSHGDAGIHIEGLLHGEELTRLGQQFADEIDCQLFPDDGGRTAFHSTDTLATQAFARAMQLCGEDRWDKAARLLQVVLDIEPDNVAARLKYLQVLIQRNDPAAFALGEQLLAEARATADLRLESVVHAAVGQAYLQANVKEAVDLARHHLDKAIWVVRQHEEEDWMIDVYMSRSLVGQIQRDYATALHYCEKAERANSATGNVLRRSTILSRRAIMETTSGNRLVAKQLLEECASIFSTHGLKGREVFVLAILAQINTWLGFRHLGVQLCDRIEAMLPALENDVRAVAFALAWMSVVQAETSSLPKLDKLLALAEPFRNHPLPMIRAAWLVVHAHRAAATRHWDSACTALAMAVDLAAEHKAAMLEQFWMPALLHLLGRAERWTQATTWRARAQQLPTFSQDGELEGSVLHNQAAELHAEGDLDGAMAKLSGAIDRLPIGRWSAYARFDLAWMYVERDDLPQARRMLKDLGPWLKSHPLGMLTDARLKFASGAWQEACDAQQRHAEATRLSPAPYAQALLTFYLATAHRGSAPEQLPGTPRLPSLL